eukprot:g27072.t1
MDKENYQFSWDNTKILGQAKQTQAREFLEAWYSVKKAINKHIELDPIYTPLRRKTGTPEILRGCAYGPEVDMWSVGVITYILLCGFEPFYDERGDQYMYKRILNCDYDFVSPWWDEVSLNAKDLGWYWLGRVQRYFLFIHLWDVVITGWASIYSPSLVALQKMV